MKRGKPGMPPRRAVAATTALAVVLGLVSAPPAHAAGTDQLLTDHVVQITETVSEAGFVHPGIGLSAEDLRTAQAKARSGVEPWASYFEAMASTSFASTTYRASNSRSAAEPDQPLDDSFSQVGLRYRETDDSFGALTQALMFVVTGNEVYRRNAIQGLRTWSRLDPTKFAYFADAHIHTGHPLYQFLMAAEIIRATAPVNDDTPGTYEGYDVVWHPEDDTALLDNFARRVVAVFTPSNTRYMNQHNFGLFARIATAIYADDAPGYAEGVEWFTVNSTYDGYDNGALAPLFPLIAADDPNNPYGYAFVQHQEMGRDQAHAECDVDNFTGLARILEVQGTAVDPVAGTVSTAADAVSIYDFLDHRLLDGANAFFGFMMGASVPWIDTRQLGGAISQAYRGRMFNPLSELYNEYQYERGVDVTAAAPWVATLAARQDGPLYYYGTGVANFWAPGDKNPEYWVAFPEELAHVEPAALPESASLTFAGHSLRLDERTTLVTEDGHGFARARVDEQGTLSVVSRMMFGSSPIGVRLRTDGPVRLDVLGTAEAVAPWASVEVPDTDGKWRYVVYPSGGTNTHFYRLTGAAGATVDLDSVTLSAETDLTPPRFPTEGTRRYLVAGTREVIDLAATDTGGPVAYRASGLPGGATLDAETGALTWTPVAGDVGRHGVQIVADDGQTVAARSIELVVSADRAAMIAATVADQTDPETTYTSVSRARLEAALATAEALAGEGSADEFRAAFADLLAALAGLELLNPRLADRSLAYHGIVTPTVLSSGGLNSLVDGDNTSHTGDLRVGSFRIDFGPTYRVAVESFALQARFSFPNRSQGTNVYGSNDGSTWTLLTERASTETNDQETIPVIAERRGTAYRFLKVQVDHPGVPTDPAYPGIWSIAELHVFGERQEVPGTVTSVSVSSPEALRGRVTAGDHVALSFTSATPITEVAVTIGGRPVYAASDDGRSWTATTVLDDVTGGGTLAFTIDHTTTSGQRAAPVTAATDGSSLYASDERNLVDLANATVVDDAGNPDPGKAAHGEAMLDANVATSSDVAPDGGQATLVWDLGAGRAVALDRAEVLVRQDNNGLTRQADQVIEGSNDLRTWTRLTGTTTKEFDWQNLPALDDRQYQYLRVRNGDRIGVAELRLFGTLHVDLGAVLAEADATDLTPYSRASAITFTREVAAVRAASQQPDADTNTLGLRLLDAWDLLEPAPLETIPVQRSWIVASSPSWDGRHNEADNGWAMFDGDPATFTDTQQASGWVRVLPAEQTQFAVDMVRFLPRAGYASRASNIQFQGSIDGGVTWQTFATSGEVSAAVWTEITLPETIQYGAIRVYASAGNTNVAEVQFVHTAVDSTGLDLYLTETAPLAEDDWTPETWAALAGARQVALALRADGATPDQAQVDAATDALAAAVVALESAVPPGHTPEVPGQGVLWSDSGWAYGLADGNYTVTMSLWWGANATRVKLYEDGQLIATRDLADDTPNAQHVQVPVTGRVNGVYEYVAVLINRNGQTTTQPLSVEVSDAAPGAGVLSHDNWDGDGDYTVHFNLWWGTNGTTYRLYEDGTLVDTQQVTADTPAAQHAATHLTGRTPGTHTYKAELANAAGVTTTKVITVRVNG